MYGATGEGLTHGMAIVAAKSKNAAKKEYVTKYVCDVCLTDEHKKSCIDYFSLCVSVHEWHKKSNHDVIKEILKRFFSESIINSMFEAEKYAAMHEFNFKLYTNYS